MRILSLSEVLELHRRILADTGGGDGIRDFGALLSAIHQPQASFSGQPLYPSLEEKVAALGYSLVDGNKRIGHACIEMTLMLNGREFTASVVDQERFMLALASGEVSREELVDWIREHSDSR